MNIRKYLPKWLNELIPTIGYQRLSRQEVLQLDLDRFAKWEGLYVSWPVVGDQQVIEKGYLLWARRVPSPKPPNNPPLAPA